MADETQATPVAGAENATQEQDMTVADQEKALKQQFPTLTGFLYLSDVDNTLAIWHHKVIPTFHGEERLAANFPW